MPYVNAIIAIVGSVAAGVSAGASISSGIEQEQAMTKAGKEARALGERDRRDRLKQDRVTNKLRQRQTEFSERAIGLQEKAFDYKKELGERGIRAAGVQQAASILEKAAAKDRNFKAFLSKQYNPKVGV